MTSASDKVEQIFWEALQLASEADRSAYLDKACGGDQEFRRLVEKLLRAQPKAAAFLEQPFATGLPDHSGIQSGIEAGSEAFSATGLEPIREVSGTVIGPYKLLQQIGEGGMGIVWMAEQTRPVHRKVALKVIKPGMDSRQVIARFEAERQALALMDHVNIARVFDGGTVPFSIDDLRFSIGKQKVAEEQSALENLKSKIENVGRPYFVMELVHGVPITKYCDDRHLTPRERLELFVPVCNAIQHAHQKGIIHRDIKPSNVMVTLYDGKPVPKVIDFGVAKATEQKLTERTLFTQYGAMVGTLEYMSPEQAEMSALGVDTRSDIYSLGVLLYELLTGSTPLTRKRMKEAPYAEIVRMIKEEEPPKPSTRLSDSSETLATVSAQRQTEPAKLTKLVRGELDWIVMKCLEKDRNRRYESASALAADVQRYLHDEPVHACPPSAWYRFSKFARRNKAVMATAAAVALVVSATIAVSTALIWGALARERREANFHRITLAHRELSVDNLGRAVKLLKECPEDLREWTWHYLMRLCRVEPMVITDDDGTEVNCVVFSRDGDRLAAAGADGSVKIRNSKTGKVIRTFRAHSSSVVCVAFHPVGKHLASRGVDKMIKVWDLTAIDQPVWSEPCDENRKFGSAYTVAFSPDGRLLAGGTDGVVKVWDWKNGRLLSSLPEHDFHSIPVTFSRDGRLATGTFGKGVKLWDPESGRLLRHIQTQGHHPGTALAFSLDGNWLASASLGRSVTLSDSRTGRRRQTFDLHTGNVECVAVSPDGRLLASAGEDKTVRIWDAETGREVLGLQGHTERCGCVAFSPDGNRLVSASSDGTIRIWDGTPLRGDEPTQEILTFHEHSDEIRSVAFCPGLQGERGRGEGWYIASSGHDGIVKVWDARTRQVTAEFKGHVEAMGRRVVVFCLAWHPKGHRIASVGVDTVRVWDARTEQKVFELPARQEKSALPFSAVTFSPDGSYLLTGRTDGAVQVWDAETGKPIGTLDTHKRDVRGLVFSRDSEQLTAASTDGAVKLWDKKSLDKVRLAEKQEPRDAFRARVPGPSVNVAFSPDGRRLAMGAERNTVKIRDLQTGKELQLWGHKGEVYTLAFSPDAEGRWVASAGEDSVVRVWDSHTGKLVRNFRSHTGLVSSLSFSPDGRLLVSGSRDHTVKVWDLTQLDKE